MAQIVWELYVTKSFIKHIAPQPNQICGKRCQHMEDGNTTNDQKIDDLHVI